MQNLPSANPSDQFNRIKNAYYVSTNASITDHADTAQSGSIADIITNEMSGAQGDLVLPGNKTYQVKQALTIPVTARLVSQKGATIDTDMSIRSASYQWTLSGSGTNEYYLEASGGGNPNINEPDDVAENDAQMTAGTVGSLTAGEWDWGNNDTLGYNTVYVRLLDSTDPDGKAADYVEACWTLTVNGPFQEGMDQIFTGNGDVSFNHRTVKIVSPEWFGAIADNSTDSTGAIQKAIDACPLGGVVYLSITDSATGGYIVSNLTLKKPMTLCGGGRGSILKAKSGSTGYVLNIDGEASGASVSEHGASHGQLYGVAIRDLHLDGNLRSPDIGGIKQQTAEHCLYQNLWIEDFKREAINFYRSNRETYVTNVWTRWCANKTAERTGYPCINLDDAGGGNDTNNGIYFNNLAIVYPFGDGVWIDTASGTAYNIRHCIFSACFYHGTSPVVDGAGNNPFNSTFTAAQKAYHMFDIGTARQIQITDSFFAVLSGYETAGIIIQTGSDGAPSDILINNCHMEGRYSTGADATKDIMVHLKNGNLTFDGNRMDGSGDVGASNLTVESAGTLRLGILNNLSGSGPTIPTNTLKNPLIAKIGVPVDLSGAAVSQVVLYGIPRKALLLRAVLIYTEASSADAGIPIKLGKVSDDDYYYTGATVVNRTQWEVTGLTLLKNDISEYEVITFTSVGGKTGEGEVILAIEYAMLYR